MSTITITITITRYEHENSMFDTEEENRTMQLEHFAINVADPVAMAEWYVKNLGMEVVRKSDSAAKTHFIMDSAGHVMLEIYNNPPEAVPDYAQMNPLLLHVAFVSADPVGDKDRLLAAGATFVEEINMTDGSHLFMLRDPWGLAIQLCKRAVPFKKV